ncbi:cyclic nucleotide-binding and patatin-like phospholipase domain-containing protein [Roseicyclus sp. F158]|uniref:Cyclic nucleotide-binding and patatin-like phospholipase domain-containing protein n=1 Tax=Tropicimonas omnivorans TaxID=3075590 RepID=A0ABU3DKU9_9RHOB|nr:cyclic nucleotide-binding and patatin-like phospholipase domain-containing protein [Roseicyclus sp. F158]MDT0684338.1 cyclic nucleotide-binding and patatin-like phospholipase domain-containing protein [Roseicyclus sp. F158]
MTRADAAMFDAATEAALRRHGHLRKLQRGERLIAAGDPAETLYLVTLGRFHVIAGGGVIAEISEGQPIGEIAFFTGGVRTADVVAARTAEVICLGRDGWEEAARQTDVPSRVLASLAARLAEAVPHVPRLAPAPPGIVALVPAGNRAVPGEFAEPFARGLFGKAPLRAGDLPAELRNDAEGIARWFHTREAEGGGQAIWIEDMELTPFAEAALSESDAAILVGDAEADPRILPLEAEALRLHRPEARHLVLRRRSGTTITGTARWLEGRDPHMHHHLAGEADLARAARLVGGRGLGLVLAGGGALCCAHLGVARALGEAGVEIDTYAGTSGGAAMAIALASGLSPPEVLRRSEEIFVWSAALKKLTVPIHALLDHHPFDASLKHHYGSVQLEDLPVPVLAVSASLTRNDVHLHRTGPAWMAVRASGSLPGLLPPVVTEDGEILIDGGVIDNLPVGPLQSIKLGPNLVIGLSQPTEWRVTSSYDRLPPRFRLARDLALRRHDPADFPRIMQILQKGMGITSRRAMATASMRGNLLLVPPIPPHLGLMDWHAGAELEAIGYAHMREQIEAGVLDELTA